MGLLPTGLFRSRDARQRLPLYETIHSPKSSKERYSDPEDDSSDDYDDDDYDDDSHLDDHEHDGGAGAGDVDGYYPSPADSPTASSRGSRQSSGSAATTSLMLPKRGLADAALLSSSSPPPAGLLSRLTTKPSRPWPQGRRRQARPSTMAAAARRRMYRLPSRIVRYLCIALMMTIVVLILSLVRASQNENRRIASGQVTKPPQPPPVWESFDFLTRYYGGVRNLVSLSDNVPQYPREEDEQVYGTADASGAAAAHTTAAGRADAGSEGDGDDATAAAAAAPRVHLHAAAAVAASSLRSGDQKATVPDSKVFAEHPGSVFDQQAALASSGGSSIAAAEPCYIDTQGTVQVPPLRYLDGRPSGFPQNILGSYELLGLPEDICMERYGRYGPYGYGYSVRAGGLGVGEYGEKEGADAVWAAAHRVDYRSVDWADVQQRCYAANAHRFKPPAQLSVPVYGYYPRNTSVPPSLPPHARRRDEEPPAAVDDAVPAPAPAATPAAAAAPAAEVHRKQGDAPRTAVVVRCWDEFVWAEEDIMNLRALIAELSLASGSRYDVHLLVQVKDDAKNPIWADDEIYRQRIVDTVPAEFRGLVTLWTETQMLALYQGIHDLFTRGPGLPVHGVYRGLQMAMQQFAHSHPEYDYFWQWEMDIRYTGHNLDLFTKMEDWARQQPRKGLWERNARFYVPSVHGSWDDFRQMARVQTEVGLTGADNIWHHVAGGGKSGKPNGGNKAGKGGDSVHEKVRVGEETVWGPVRPADPGDWFEPELDPEPPTTYEKDRYVWGVGEDADLITLNPIFDPEGTTWLLADDITGYNETAEGGKAPRRAQIITASRLSGRLLRTMHRETALKKHHAFSEMWPATVALQHGYKAVYVPHPVYVDREWPTQYMARTFNGGRNGASGGSRTSVFGQREHNFLGLTWYYNAGFAPNLFQRWLGLRVNNDGGADFEEHADLSKNDSAVSHMRGGEGRMCLPPMLLHPVKNVVLPVESTMGDDDYNKASTAEADPSA